MSIVLPHPPRFGSSLAAEIPLSLSCCSERGGRGVEPAEEEEAGGGGNLCRIPPLNTIGLLWMTDAA